MNSKLFVLLSLFFMVGTTFGLAESAITEPELEEAIEAVEKKEEETKAEDSFLKELDDLDAQLALLAVKEGKPQKSWWITKQIKNFCIKWGLRALPYYIIVHEFCSDSWQSVSKKIRRLIGLVHTTKLKKKTHEHQKAR